MRPSGKPKIVCLCGSSRFVDVMAVVGWIIERDEHAIVVGLHLLPRWYAAGIDDHIAEVQGAASEMDELHLRKIALADEIFIVNCDGYVGESTKREILYAKAKGKAVRWLSCDQIGTRFFHEIEKLKVEQTERIS